MHCPNCQLNVRKRVERFSFENLTVHFYKCPNCDYVFAGTQSRGKMIELPSDTMLPNKFPESIKELSPEAFRLYCEAITAHQNGLSLAGVGLRAALENLLTDYLKTMLHIPETDIPPNLSAKARKMNDLTGNFYANVCAKIVRCFGNDSAHSSTKFPDLNFSDALLAFNLLCELIQSERRILEINTMLENS